MSPSVCFDQGFENGKSFRGWVLATECSWAHSGQMKRWLGELGAGKCVALWDNEGWGC